MMELPTISVIMPNLDGRRYLDRAVRSFLMQEHEKKQLVIVDNRSADGSHELIEELARDNPSVCWIKEDESGLSEAINLGVQRSSGEIIGYLGSDDLLLPGTLSRVASWAMLVDYDAIYFDSYIYHVKRKLVARRHCPRFDFTRQNLLTRGNIVALQNIYFKRHVFEGRQFDPGMKYAMDYDFFLQISDDDYLYLHVDVPATINMFDGNISERLSEAQANEAAAIARKHSRGGERLYFERRNPLWIRAWNRLDRVMKRVAGQG